jgi:hypothetical protein
MCERHGERERMRKREREKERKIDRERERGVSILTQACMEMYPLQGDGTTEGNTAPW